MSILRLLVLDSSHCFDDLKLDLRLNVDLKIKDSRLLLRHDDSNELSAFNLCFQLKYFM